MEPSDLNAKLLSLCRELQKPELRDILDKRWPMFNPTIKAFLLLSPNSIDINTFLKKW